MGNPSGLLAVFRIDRCHGRHQHRLGCPALAVASNVTRDNTPSAYVHDLQRESSAQAARDDAATVEREAETLELGGRATTLTVIDAQRTLAASEQSLAQLKSAISDDQVSVFLALGGGWEHAPEAGATRGIAGQ